MLIKKFYYREIAVNAFKILAILIVILPFTESFHLLEKAVTGQIPVIILFVMVFYGVIASFPIIVNIATFISIAIAINRMCKQSEFVVWLSSGVSPFYWLKQTLLFVVPITIMCIGYYVFIEPWVIVKSDQYKEYMMKKQLSIALSPGMFRDNLDGQQVFYIENFSINDGSAQGIFFENFDKNLLLYNINAQSGYINSKLRDIFITLKNGNMYKIDAVDRSAMFIHFDKLVSGLKALKDYGNIHNNDNVNAEHDTVDNQVNKISKGYHLVTSDTYKENVKKKLPWRISLALMIIGMSLITLAITIQKKRAQSNILFILPPIILAIYQGMLYTVRSHVGTTSFNALLTFFVVHFIVIAIALLLTFYKSLPK